MRFFSAFALAAFFASPAVAATLQLPAREDEAGMKRIRAQFDRNFPEKTRAESKCFSVELPPGWALINNYGTAADPCNGASFYGQKLKALVVLSVRKQESPRKPFDPKTDKLDASKFARFVQRGGVYWMVGKPKELEGVLFPDVKFGRDDRAVFGDKEFSLKISYAADAALPELEKIAASVKLK